MDRPSRLGRAGARCGEHAVAAVVHEGHDFQLFHGLVQVGDEDQVVKAFDVAQPGLELGQQLHAACLVGRACRLYGHAHRIGEAAAHMADGAAAYALRGGIAHALAVPWGLSRRVSAAISAAAAMRDVVSMER